MFAYERATVVLRRQRLRGVEHQAQRRHVRADGVVRHDGLGHQVRALRLHALVHVLAVVAVGPAVEAVFLHRGQVIGHQVGTDLVALVGHRPQLASARLQVQAGGVADARCVDAAATGGHVHFQHHRAAVFDSQPVLGDVAVGAHAHVQLAAIGARAQILGPVVVDGAGQVGELAAPVGHAGFAGHVVVLHDVAGVGHVQRVTDELDAERRMQAFDVDVLGPGVGARRAAQQGDPVAALAGLARTRLHLAGDPLLGRGDRLFAGAVAFHHQHIAVGQGEQAARVLQVGGDALDLQALGHGGRLAVGPAHALGHLHGRHEEVGRLGQRRLRTGLVGRVVFGLARAGGQHHRKREDAQRGQDAISHDDLRAAPAAAATAG